MGISRSTYYEHTEAKEEQRILADLEIKNMIESVHTEFPGYGYRRLHAHFERCGLIINEKRIRRIMKQYGIHPIRFRKFVRTTDSKHSNKIYPNLLRDTDIVRPNQVWVADVTYIRLKTCFAYLAVILDRFSRKIVGWALSKSIDTKLTLTALQMAIEERKAGKGVIHHSDRGVQYACKDYVAELSRYGFQISMSRRGNPYDNANCEAFMKTLKYEEVHLWNYDSLEEALERIPEFLEAVYNRKRLHSALGYMPPEEFEMRWLAKQSNKVDAHPL